MPSEILLVNPARRPKKRRANPARRTRAKNPSRSRVHHKVHAISAHHRRRRRNPISLKGEGIGDMLKTAVLAGAGSVGVDVLMGQIRGMLPSSVNTGNGYAAAKAAITLALGVFGKKLLGPKAVRIAEGALTVQVANLITGIVQSNSSMSLGGRGRSFTAQRHGLGFANKGVAAIGAQPNRQTMLPAGRGFSGVGSARTREGTRR